MDTKRFQIFISSTYADLRQEREHVINELNKVGHIAAGMEQFPATDETQLEYIKHIIRDSDYCVVIVKGRYGSLSETGISFTEREYELAQAAKLPTLAFIYKHRSQLTIDQTDQDDDKSKLLKEFIGRLTNSKIVHYWTTSEDLATSVKDSIYDLIRRNPSVGWVRGDRAISTEVLNTLETLRRENADLKKRVQQLSSDEGVYEETKGLLIPLKADVLVHEASEVTTSYATPKSRVVRQIEVRVHVHDVMHAVFDGLKYSALEPAVFMPLMNLVQQLSTTAPGEMIGIDHSQTLALRAHLENMGLIELYSDRNGERWLTTARGRKLLNHIFISRSEAARVSAQLE